MTTAHTGHQHGHGHGHGHGHDFDWDGEGERLEGAASVDVDHLTAAAEWLAGLPTHPVRDILDVGSGPGVASCVFASTFPDATVTAFDGSAVLLERAAARAERLGVRVATRQGELPEGLDGVGPVDLVWASRVVHHVGDQVGVLRRMGELLRPGGVVAIVEGGLPMRSLPRDIGMGRAGLIQRIEAASMDWFLEMRNAQRDATAVVEDWRGMLEAAGLTPSGTRSFLTDRPAPVDAATRAVVVDEWSLRAEQAGPLLADDDRATLDRLLDPDDEMSLHRRPDVFLLAADTVYTARRDA